MMSKKREFDDCDILRILKTLYFLKGEGRMRVQLEKQTVCHPHLGPLPQQGRGGKTASIVN